MSEVKAWFLELGDGLLAAVGELEMIHVLPYEPALFEIPQSPAYCRNVLVWRSKILPLMDLCARLLDRSAAESQGVFAIVAFQEFPGAETRHGALILSAPPVRIRVNDSQACDLPDCLSDWRNLAIACFEQAGHGPVPILDLGKVFSLPQGGADECVGQQPASKAIFQI